MSKISFVIPCYRSVKTLPKVVDEIKSTIEKKGNDSYEIILVNDCSPDDTFETIRKLVKKDSNIIGIDMAKNFGQHAALMAGLRETTGDYVVCLDDDGQTPADEVYKLIDKLEEGYDAVYGAYETKMHSRLRNWGSKLNNLMSECLLDKPKDIYVSSYFVIKRFVVDEIVKYPNPYPYVLGLVLRTTKHIACVQIKHRARVEGKSGYTFSKLVTLWINGFTAFSVKPLRIATVMGLVFASLGLVYCIYAIINKIINPLAPMGWTSTIVILLILGGMILFVIGMIGEYIGRIYISINNSPQYVVREKIGDR